MPRAQTPPSRSSKSAAVRRALERPSARQLSKWQRERRQRRVIWGLAIAVPLLIAAILGFGYWRENVARGSETAATLFGATVTMDDLVPWVTPRVKGVEQVLSMYRAQGMTQAEAQLGQQLNRVPDQVVNDRVEAVLIKREADKRGVSVTDQEVEAKLRQKMAEDVAASAPPPTATAAPTAQPSGTVAAAASAQSTAGATAEASASPVESPTPEGTPTEAPTPTPVPTLAEDRFKTEYDTFLTRTGYSDDQYRQVTREELLREKLTAAVGADVAANQEQVHARQIQVASREQAQQVLDKLQQGQKFEDLAKTMSTDATSKDKGGDLGWLPRGFQSAPWDEAAFGLQAGQRSGIVADSGRGFVVIEVLERDANRPLGKEQLDQLRTDAFQKWLTTAKADDGVKIPSLTAEQRAYVLRKAGAPRLAG